MRERIEQRLAELRSELAAGEKMAAELEAKRSELRATMLRIAGAIQVLEETLAAEPAADRAPGAAPLPAPGNGADRAPPG